MPSSSSPWLHDRTFGGKAKDFWWRAGDDGSITIRRVFETRGPGTDVRVRAITRRELDQLLAAMADGRWWPLADNVEKLTNGTEKDGLGKFLCERFGWTPTDAQLAGHLGVILSGAGIWDYNGRKRGIEFRLADSDMGRVKTYHERRRAALQAP